MIRESRDTWEHSWSKLDRDKDYSSKTGTTAQRQSQGCKTHKLGRGREYQAHNRQTWPSAGELETQETEGENKQRHDWGNR